MTDQRAIENGFMTEPGFEWGAIEGEAVRRVGVVDVGSNSVRLVVFDGVARAPAYFYNEKILCGLGVGLQESGRLNPDGRVRAMDAIRRFAALARVMKVTGLTGVATAAVREAEDGPEFCADVARETGLALHVASGEDEAELSAKGVLLGWPHATGVVCDIGGASMEMARVDDGVIGPRASSPLGPQRLAGLGSDAAVDRRISAEVAKLAGVVGRAPRRLYLVGGSWRAIARLDMERRNYPLKVLHEYRIGVRDALDTCDWIEARSLDELHGLTETSSARLELVPLAVHVLRGVIAGLEPAALSVSSYGLREGLLYEMMPESLRAKDPLLEASRHMEQTRARFPGFGDSLFRWLQPLYPGADENTLRLVHAACYLHDITWRAHPDYRAEVCFGAVTRANLSGLDHEGRVFLGAAILNRYKSSARSYPEVISLLREARQDEAEILGKAIRLGAMLSGAAPGSLENTEIALDEAEIVLTLRGTARDLRGEAVDRRLASLAARIGRTGRVALED